MSFRIPFNIKVGKVEKGYPADKAGLQRRR